MGSGAALLRGPFRFAQQGLSKSQIPTFDADDYASPRNFGAGQSPQQPKISLSYFEPGRMSALWGQKANILLLQAACGLD